jgi:hypothetical protein
MTNEELIKLIQDALGTEETGEALIEVARNAHRAEMELASTYNWDEDEDGPDQGSMYELVREQPPLK